MTQLIINVGAAPNDGQGDPIRTAFQKTNTNFSELFSKTQAVPPVSLIGTVGDTAGMVAYDSDFYYYCFQDFDGSSIIWRQVPNAALAQITDLDASGNIDVGGYANVVGNVTANYFIGDGSQLTNVSAGAATELINGNSNVKVYANGPVTISTAGASNVLQVRESIFTPGTYGVVINGFANVLGTLSGANITTLGSISAVANVTGGNLITSGAIEGASLSLTGNILSNALINGNIAVGGNVLSDLNSNGNINLAGSLSAVGNVTGNFLFGDGGFISNVTAFSNVAATQLANGSTVLTVDGSGGNVTVTVGGVSNVALITTTGMNLLGAFNATGNVTAANLTSNNRVVATGNVIGGNLTTGGQVSATGNITGGNIISNGLLIATGNITGNNLSVTNTGNIGNLVVPGTTTLIGSITQAITVTGNITSTANLSAGNAIIGNAITAGTTISAVANITGGNIVSVGQVSAGTLISAVGNVEGANLYILNRAVAVGNINAGNLITSGLLLTTGNVTGGNIVTNGQVSAVGNVTGGNLITAGLITASGNVTAGNIQTSGSIGATGNISATGNIAGGNLALGTGLLVVGSILNGNGNGVGNIGNATGYFNTIFAQATSAQYADIAENYLADQSYAPGTVVKFGGSAEITLCVADADPEVAGVISSHPAVRMNSTLDGPNVVTLALTGRVPCQVIGKVWPGAMMVSAGNGFARAERNPAMGTVIGKALTAHEGGQGIIEIVVGRL